MSKSFKINRNQFASMLSKVSKAAAKSAIEPLTELVQIEVHNNKLALSATDARTTFVQRCALDSEVDDFTVAIKIMLFERVVSRITTESLEFKLEGDILVMKGNGIYKFPVTMEESTIVKLPPINIINEGEDFKIQISVKEMKDIIAATCRFVAPASIRPQFAGYWFGNEVIATETNVVCFYHKQVFPTPTYLLSSAVELLTLVDDETITVVKKGQRIQFRGATTLLDTREHEQMDTFPAEDLCGHLQVEYPSKAVMNVKDFRGVIDRVMLFVDPVKHNYGCIFSFEKDGLAVNDKAGCFHEKVMYQTVEGFQPFVCEMGADSMQILLDLPDQETVDVYFGSEAVLKLDCPEYTRVAGTLVDEDDDLSEFLDNAADSSDVSVPSDFSETSQSAADSESSSAAYSEPVAEASVDPLMDVDWS